VGVTGFEHGIDTQENQGSDAERSISVATASILTPIDADLETWLDGCPVALEQRSRDAILGIIKSVTAALPPCHPAQQVQNG
jgi:hypothetical protein